MTPHSPLRRRLRRRDGMSPATRHFVRHYVEMVVVMFVGMGVLALPVDWALSAAGTSYAELGDGAMLFGMAVTMTAPMVAWMAWRGHSRRASAEMAASMFVPAFAAMALLGANVVADAGALMLGEHVAMLLGMLAVMLLRRDEYAHGSHAAPEAVVA
jgi:hypothetical protein